MEDAAHSEGQRTGSHGGRRIPWLMYIPFLLLIYFLSTGPAAWLSEKVPATQEVLDVLYAPVGYLKDKCPPFQKAFEWYLTKIWHFDME